MTNSNRDNFSEKTKRTLAERVGLRCSSPGCERPTHGPSLCDTDRVNIGVAAHITSASAGTKEKPGPRYDPLLTSAKRKDITNGIWLCQNCAKLIDSDIKSFPVALLLQWKKDAEALAFEAVATSGAIRQRTAMKLDDADKEYLKSLTLPNEDDISTISERMNIAAAIDIATFRSAREWPSYEIPLNLTLLGKSEQTTVTLDGIAKAVASTDGVCFISPPGTGKTTSLVQLADTIIDSGQIAALVPLSEWSDRQESFFEFLIRRNAFHAFQQQHFMQLAYHGRLVLLLDGWNELNSDARKRAHHDLKTLRREFTQLGIVIGTRRQAIPISGAIIKIEGLSNDQQLKIACKLRGQEGEALIDQAWRTSSLRELISIPLYLNTLITITPETEFPKTKEEILNAFVTQHENAPEKKEILHTALLSFHKDMLIGLAVEMNQNASPSLTDDNARPVISKVVKKLQASQQLTTPLQPTTVLDVLVNTHSLIRGNENISFQHQQFQEWYASFEVERLMIAAANGNVEAQASLRSDVLNWLAWEESVLFACERLSKEPDSVKAVAAAIIDALTVDPMLAAEMIYRSNQQTWEHIHKKVVEFVKRWHQPDKIDRAVRFMITCGRPEFAEYIWPLVSNSDSQVYLHAIRFARYFRPSVLGSNVKEKLEALPEDTRGSVIGEIAYHSSFDGIELATAIAKNDSNPSVVAKILQLLRYSNADHHIADILTTASDQVWKRIALDDYPEKLIDVQQNERLIKMRKEIIAEETDAIRIINHLIEGKLVDEKAEERITQLIKSPDFPIENSYARVTLENALRTFPSAAESGMLQRIVSGLKLPFRAEKLLRNIKHIDSGPITDVALDKTIPENQENVAWSIVGPVTVGKMMDALLAINDECNSNDRRSTDSEHKEIRRLENAIASSRETSFHKALLERANTDNPFHIKLMADLIARHGGEHEKERFQLCTDIEEQLSSVIKEWINVMLTSPDATRHQFYNIARAIRRVPRTQFVLDLQKLLERDFEEREKEIEEFKKTHVRTSGACMCYTMQYRQAFAAIGDSSVVALMKHYLPDTRQGSFAEFGFDAACVLLEIRKRSQLSEKDEMFSGWPDFSNAKEHRKIRENKEEELPTCEFAETIFKEVRKLGQPDNDDLLQRHALKLAKVALSMPYGIKNTEIDLLVSLPQPYAYKRDLLSALAIAGEMLSADMLLEGFHELLECAKKEKWRVGGNQCEVMYWVELFAFSDRPLAIIDILHLLPKDYRFPRDYNRLLTALGYSPHSESLEVLKTLAENIPEMFNEYEWLNAVMRLETLESAQAVLNLICDGKIDNRHRDFGDRRLLEQFANIVGNFPSLHDKILQRYEKSSGGRPRAILEAILIEVGDANTVLAIIRSRGERMEYYDSRLARAIEKIAIGQEPVKDWPGAYEEFSVPLTDFRKELFAISLAGGKQAELAEACLDKIEMLRDEHGRINDEPRHPDINS